MKNIEKYEEELKKGITKFKRIPCIAKELKDGCPAICQNRNCVICGLEMLHWLSQEYEEHILTDDENVYLKATITYFKKDDYLISKQERNSIDYICIAKAIGDDRYDVVLNLDLTYFKFKFNNMEDYRWYKLEELNLC